MTFDELIQLAREQAGTVQRDKGTLFERIAKIYFQNEPTYKNLFSDVWLLNEVPDEYEIPKKDTGVDLVARNESTGELTAIQAKFYDNKIYKRHIDSFLAELGKSYYSDGIIVYSLDSLSSNADEAINQLSKPVVQIGLSDLRNSRVEWESFIPNTSEKVKVRSIKQTRPYQNEAIDLTLNYFKEHDRGQLVMAPGTGKTFTSLKLVERMAKQSPNDTFNVLYLVPSIQLLSQTLIGWNNDTELSMHSFAVTSDRNASKKKSEDELSAKDIGFPATTNSKKLISNYRKIEDNPRNLTVVYSTYQSIEVLHEAQEQGFPDFDIIICDEAHRTTGAKALGAEASVFTRVHNNAYIRANKRLYQTATPKIYGNDAKQKAEDSSVVLSSMDNKDIYGEEIYRLGFGEAVSRDILTDYKVMVLAVDESVVQKDMQRSIADLENGLEIDDISKLIGVWNGLMKRNSVEKDSLFDGKPMQRAISFINTIENSKVVANQFNEVVNEYLEGTSEIDQSINVKHVDGMMNALQKKEALDWLSEDFSEDETRILSNVKFLTEGIDVPNLDAIIFLSPKKSQVDIVQAVGRIMRKFESKDYGYIILPIVIPAGTHAEALLDNNKEYDAVWQILNALRSVDERFSAMINKLQLNKSKPKNLSTRLIGKAPSDDDVRDYADKSGEQTTNEQLALEFDWEEVENAIYAKIVQKVGDRRYLEDWSEDVAKIAQRHIEQISLMIQDKNSPTAVEFEKFLKSLKHNINESIDEKQAIEMLAQHLITEPVFEALFGEFSFIKNNPVSEAMNKIVEELSMFGGFSKEQNELQGFYDSVKIRAEGIDNAEAKQKIIITLYDKFFSKGFKETTQRLGIVFTPVEVVDFIVKSVDDVLKKHFGKSLESEGVHILDPFTGTGTFIVRTLHYLKNKLANGEITLAELTQKYMQELHANEIVLLSYYIAAINIESTFSEINNQDYQPFEGIVLTDTFESTEQEDTLDDSFFGTNDERLKRQQEVPITVILGNPPYSKSQTSENDNNKNVEYRKLFSSIANSYVANTNSSSVLSLYDSYILAFRWATDILKDKGIIAFITNHSFIDTKSSEGLRKCWYQEFNHIYIMNLRGAIRQKSGDLAKKEGDNIFDIMTGVAIVILVKDNTDIHEINYHDIGDYLNRNQKFDTLNTAKSVLGVTWDKIIPDKNNDWINKRDANFEKYQALSDEYNSYFNVKDIGIVTNRDAWVSNFSITNLTNNVSKIIENYNLEVEKIDNNKSEIMNELEVDNKKLDDKTIAKYLTEDEKKVSWSRSLKQKAVRGLKTELDKDSFLISMYRPFTKKYLYRNKFLNENVRKTYQTFPTNNHDNLLINVPGPGYDGEFSTIITNVPVVMDGTYKSRNFPKYIYSDNNLFGDKENNIVNEDDFYYIYAVLHIPEYRKIFAKDLRKTLPRIPLLKNKEKFIEIGRYLANLHINYENQSSWNEVTIIGEDSGDFKVKKMKHPKIKNRLGKSVNDLSQIVFNEHITITNIPERSYEYVVNGKPAIEWIIDQYQVKTDKKSGIVDDPNEFSDNPKYIFNLLLSIINVSMQTINLVESLPPLEIIEPETQE